MAVRYDLPDVVRLAARGFLLVEDPLTFGEELRELDGSAYHRLLAYRSRCRDSLKTLGDTSCSDWALKRKGSTPGTSFGCPTCAISNPLHSGLKKRSYCSKWFHDHWTRLFLVLAATPDAEAIADASHMNQAVKDAAHCEHCLQVAMEQLRFFHKVLAADIEDKRQSLKGCLLAPFLSSKFDPVRSLLTLNIFPSTLVPLRPPRERRPNDPVCVRI
ncbi:hypothetical protein FKP32DRAFT_1593382 [Trametes sanguinea]|nr:hypothetical protein FKP32DRAFT_1593382 [Trametes sanguinea]